MAGHSANRVYCNLEQIKIKQFLWPLQDRLLCPFNQSIYVIVPRFCLVKLLWNPSLRFSPIQINNSFFLSISPVSTYCWSEIQLNGPEDRADVVREQGGQQGAQQDNVRVDHHQVAEIYFRCKCLIIRFLPSLVQISVQIPNSMQIFWGSNCTFWTHQA